MCNEYEYLALWEEYAEFMAALELPVTQPPAGLPRLASIRIGDTAPIIRTAGNGVELVPMKFGFPPPRPKAGPVFNFRSEGRSFASSNRCLIPATAFFEFTGSKYPKTKHRFTATAWPFMAIAGLWRDGAAAEPPAFTMLTTEPGPDVAPIHDRQIVILPPEDWSAWIYLTKPEGDLLRPSPAGTLSSAIVRHAATDAPSLLR
jgi:putative SOS response-associated peptidase YedK